MVLVNAPQNRLASLDQFRGYTVAGMFLVNFLSGFYAAPFVLHHHNTYCSYADTIMPQFFFAVGFSMRLSFGRRVMQEGTGRAYWHMIKRLLGLALVALVVYRGGPELPEGAPFNWETMEKIGFWGAIAKPLKNDWFQTLMHIAVTSLWILPVIRLRASWRVLYMLFSAVLHMGLSHVFYIEWVNTAPTGIDGGPLGFLTWTIPTMVGTLACDVVMEPRSRGSAVMRLVVWGVILSALGWLASCGTRWYDVPEHLVPLFRSQRVSKDAVIPPRENVDEWVGKLKDRQWSQVLAEPPFVPPPHSRDPHKKTAGKDDDPRQTDDNSHLYRKWNYWMMSQRCGTISYLTFGAGLSLLVYALFYVLADLVGLRIGVFRTLGSNALFGYVLHDIVGESVKQFVPKDAPAAAMWIAFAVFFLICYLIIRGLEKRGIYIKL
jgi:predicted acyltransferase